MESAYSCVGCGACGVIAQPGPCRLCPDRRAGSGARSPWPPRPPACWGLQPDQQQRAPGYHQRAGGKKNCGFVRRQSGKTSHSLLSDILPVVSRAGRPIGATLLGSRRRSPGTWAGRHTAAVASCRRRPARCRSSGTGPRSGRAPSSFSPLMYMTGVASTPRSSPIFQRGLDGGVVLLFHAGGNRVRVQACPSWPRRWQAGPAAHPRGRWSCPAGRFQPHARGGSPPWTSRRRHRLRWQRTFVSIAARIAHGWMLVSG